MKRLQIQQYRPATYALYVNLLTGHTTEAIDHLNWTPLHIYKTRYILSTVNKQNKSFKQEAHLWTRWCKTRHHHTNHTILANSVIYNRFYSVTNRFNKPLDNCCKVLIYTIWAVLSILILFLNVLQSKVP